MRALSKAANATESQRHHVCSVRFLQARRQRGQPLWRGRQREQAPPLQHLALTVLRDDDVRVGAAVLVDVVDGLLDAVHHLNAQLQVPILSSKGLHFRGAEGQIGSELGACVNFHLEQRKSRGNNRNPCEKASSHLSRDQQQAPSEATSVE